MSYRIKMWDKNDNEVYYDYKPQPTMKEMKGDQDDVTDNKDKTK